MTTQKTTPTCDSSERIEQKLGLLQDERGLSTVEYIILMVIIVVGCVGIWNSIGEKVVADLTSADEAIQEIGNSSGN